MKNTRILIFLVLIVLVAAVLVLAVVLSSTTAPQDTSAVVAGDPDDSEKAAVLRLITEGFNDGNSAVVNELYAPDYVGHIPENPIIASTLDMNMLIELIELMDSAFPNLEIESELLIQEGNTVGNRAVIRGDFLS